MTIALTGLYLSAFAFAAEALTLTSPAGGETWAAGSLHDAVQGQECIYDNFGHTLVLHLDDEPQPPESTGWARKARRLRAPLLRSPSALG